jgi:hypothetical protein
MPDSPRVVVLQYAKVDGQDRLLPEGGNPIKIKPGEKVVFVPGNEDATNLTVTFTRKSPFGDGGHLITVKGGDTFKIARAMAADAAENKYPFDCRVFLNGVPVTSVGGGEMEIIPPP